MVKRFSPAFLPILRSLRRMLLTGWPIHFEVRTSHSAVVPENSTADRLPACRICDFAYLHTLAPANLVDDSQWRWIFTVVNVYDQTRYCRWSSAFPPSVTGYFRVTAARTSNGMPLSPSHPLHQYSLFRAHLKTYHLLLSFPSLERSSIVTPAILYTLLVRSS